MKTTVVVSAALGALFALPGVLAATSQPDETPAAVGVVHATESSEAGAIAQQAGPVMATGKASDCETAQPKPAQDCVRPDGQSKMGYVGATYLLPPC